MSTHQEIQPKNLRFIRNRLFITQETFANYFNLTRHQVNAYEIGRANVPAVLIHQLCKVFNLSEEDFNTRDFTTIPTDWKTISLEVLEQELEVPKTNGVNDWREKYYTVLEKYNEALEELRKYKK